MTISAGERGLTFSGGPPRGAAAAGLRDLRARRAAGAVPGALALRVYALAQTETPADCLAVLDAVLGGA
ncbi:hypothetical protein, partial [Nocardia carnea]|uniref:hypothetical protein n=1 Tax=Nocardia carnea TaxID=37328 RepID=UPI00245633CA